MFISKEQDKVLLFKQDSSVMFETVSYLFIFKLQLRALRNGPSNVEYHEKFWMNNCRIKCKDLYSYCRLFCCCVKKA